MTHSNLGGVVDALLADHSITLPPTGEGSRQQLIEATATAIQNAYDKPYKHLAEEIPAPGKHNGKGSAATVRVALEIHERRPSWNIAQPGVVPAPTSAGFHSWARRAIGQSASLSFMSASTQFWAAHTEGRLGVAVPPVPSEPYGDTHANVLLTFWLAAPTSVLSDREVDNRLKAGESYTGMMMLADNRLYFEELSATLAAAYGMSSL